MCYRLAIKEGVATMGEKKNKIFKKTGVLSIRIPKNINDLTLEFINKCSKEGTLSKTIINALELYIVFNLNKNAVKNIQDMISEGEIGETNIDNSKMFNKPDDSFMIKNENENGMNIQDRKSLNALNRLVNSGRNNIVK